MAIFLKINRLLLYINNYTKIIYFLTFLMCWLNERRKFLISFLLFIVITLLNSNAISCGQPKCVLITMLLIYSMRGGPYCLLNSERREAISESTVTLEASSESNAGDIGSCNAASEILSHINCVNISRNSKGRGEPSGVHWTNNFETI